MTAKLLTRRGNSLFCGWTAGLFAGLHTANHALPSVALTSFAVSEATEAPRQGRELSKQARQSCVCNLHREQKDVTSRVPGMHTCVSTGCSFHAHGSKITANNRGFIHFTCKFHTPNWNRERGDCGPTPERPSTRNPTVSRVSMPVTWSASPDRHMFAGE
jgi:hypothetical protein